ncbi:MAG: MFS transporter [Xanthomonadales bacterium]|nr:MFS transporter [Xanthomonadales bacterium]
MLATEGQQQSGYLARLLKIESGEWQCLSIAFIYFFLLLTGYFMLRPIRGAIAAADTQNLHWLYTATFATMLLLVPLFGYLVSNFKRRYFLPGIYLFFISNLLVFAWLFKDGMPDIWTQRVYYVWLSVFNLFVVSIFWSFMADIFRAGQARRLFGTIAAGGSLGAVFGPLITSSVAGSIGEGGLMLSGASLLFAATIAAVWLGRHTESRARTARAESVIGGSIWEGAQKVFNSKYLIFICLLMLAHNLTATFLYNGLAYLVSEQIPEAGSARTIFFSNLDLAVNLIAFVLQFVLTSRIIAWLGMPKTMVLMPFLLAAGMLVIGSSMTLVLFASVQVAQRSMNYGLIGPLKEMLFTVVDRATKYKAKNFIDTVVYRGSDVTASWIFKGLTVLGLSLSQIAMLFIPVMGVWAVISWNLGKMYEQRASERKLP